MDFGRACLVFVKGEEKTDNLADIGIIGASINIKYKHKDLMYSYDTNSATVLSDPKIIDLSEGAVLYFNNIPLSNVKEVYQFPGFYSVYFDEAPRRTYPEATISVEQNVPYPGLQYVRPDTVLHQYMKGEISRHGAPDDKPVFYPFDYSLSQKKAIKEALSNSVSIIESTPGTGKTKTILNLILNLVMRNKTVAVVAKNKSALEHIYEKMKNEGYDFLFARPGEDVLTGSGGGKPCGFEKGGAVRQPEIISLNQKLEPMLDLEMKAKKLQEQLSLYQLEQKHFVKINEGRAVKKFSKVPGKKWEPEKKLRLWADIRLMLAEGKDEAFWPTPRCYFEYGLYDIGDVLRAESESIYSLQLSYYAGKIQELEKELKRIKVNLKNQQYERLIEYQKELSAGYIKNSLYDRYEEQSFEFNVLAYKEVYDEFECFLRRYPVIMCTADSLRDSIRRNYVYDYLIVDEASGIDLQTGLKVLSCCKNAAFIGDSKQPAPNFMTAVMDAFQDSVPRTVLREQYLCHPGVVRYFNEKIYMNELTAYGEPETPDADGAYYLRQAEKYAQPLKMTLKNEDDLKHFISYLCVDEDIGDGEAIPVYDMLYRDYDDVILSMQKSLPRRAKYRAKIRIFSMLEEILKDQRYRHLRFRYDVRLSDLEKSGETDNKVVDFVLYNVFGNKPELIIEASDSGGEKDLSRNENGIHILKLHIGDADQDKRIIKSIEGVFFNTFNKDL